MSEKSSLVAQLTEQLAYQASESNARILALEQELQAHSSTTSSKRARTTGDDAAQEVDSGVMIEQVTAEVARLKKALKEKKARIVELEHSKLTNDFIDKVKAKIKQLTDRGKEAEDEVVQLKRLVDALRTQLADNHEELELQKKLYAALEAQQRTRQGLTAAEDLSQVVSGLTADNLQLVREKREMQTKISELEMVLASSKASTTACGASSFDKENAVVRKASAVQPPVSTRSKLRGTYPASSTSVALAAVKPVSAAAEVPAAPTSNKRLRASQDDAAEPTPHFSSDVATSDVSADVAAPIIANGVEEGQPECAVQ
jgi:hypothetical protein